MRSISSKSVFYFTDAQKDRCLQLKATKKIFAHEIEAIWATWPASQSASQFKIAPNAWNRMASQSNPLGLVHKTLEGDFRKNDTISMRSPSSNAIIELIDRNKSIGH